MKKTTIPLAIACLSLSFVFSACDKYLDVTPVGQIIPQSVEEYRSFFTTAYAKDPIHKILSTYRGDEIELSPTSTGAEQYEDIYTWNDDAAQANTRQFPYSKFYSTIFYANHVIDNAKTIEGNQEAVDQLVGEAHALRAFQYFDLVNLYAPAYTHSDASVEAVPIVMHYDTEQQYPQATMGEVYTLILEDLASAKNLVNIETQPTGYNYRFSKVAVAALLSRVHLYMGNWQASIDEADAALAINNQLMNLNETQEVTPSEYNAVESILALEEVISLDLTQNASISPSLIAAYDQENDLRFAVNFRERSNGSFQSTKTTQSNFRCSFRTAELYLNKAEALARLGGTENLAAAKNTLNTLLASRYTSAGFEALSNAIATQTETELITTILIERKKELVLEGHRWFDLRRTQQPQIEKNYEGVTYILQENDQRYTIPFPDEATIYNPLL